METKIILLPNDQVCILYKLENSLIYFFIILKIHLISYFFKNLKLLSILILLQILKVLNLVNQTIIIYFLFKNSIFLTKLFYFMTFIMYNEFKLKYHFFNQILE